MGRVSRKRKIKSVDPFSKSGGVVSTVDETKFNLPPNKPQDSFTAKAKEVASLMQWGRTLAQQGKKKPKKQADGTTEGDEKKGGDALADTDVKNMKMFEGESFNAFRKRVKEVTSKQLNSMTGLTKKGISEKRKRYLAKKKLVKAGVDPDELEEDGEGQDGDTKSRKETKEEIAFKDALATGAVKDVVAFGERAERPPELKVKPRKPKLKMPIAQDVEETEEDVAKRNAAAFRQRQMEQLRDQALAAYQAMKKRRVARSSAVGKQ